MSLPCDKGVPQRKQMEEPRSDRGKEIEAVVEYANTLYIQIIRINSYSHAALKMKNINKNKNNHLNSTFPKKKSGTNNKHRDMLHVYVYIYQNIQKVP